LENISNSKTNWIQRISKSVTKLQIIWINKYRKTCEDITARLGRKGSSAQDGDCDDDNDDDDDDDDTEHDAEAVCDKPLFEGK
jgi:hypothetical protein